MLTGNDESCRGKVSAKITKINGRERYLISVLRDYIRRVEKQVLKVHAFAVNPEVLADKFKSCGFRIVLNIWDGVPVLYALRS